MNFEMRFGVFRILVVWVSSLPTPAQWLKAMGLGPTTRVSMSLETGGGGRGSGDDS